MNFKGVRPERHAVLGTELTTLLSKVPNAATRGEIRESLLSADSGEQAIGMVRLMNAVVWPIGQQGA